MEQEKTNVDDLIEHVEEYVHTKQDLFTLIAAEKSATIVSSLVAFLVVISIFLFVFVFASIALAYGISQYFGEAFAGFLAVAVLYLVIGILLFIKREQWIKTPVANAIIKGFLKNETHEKN